MPETRAGTLSFKGVEILLAEAEEMQAALGTLHARFGALHGVFHTAGELDDDLIALKTLESVEQVFAPKIQGTRILHELTAESRLDFMLLFSSTSTVTAPAGQVDYVAANAFLDAFAEGQRRNEFMEAMIKAMSADERAAAVLFYASRPVPPRPAADAARAARGAELYARNCFRCHGADGQGTMAAPPVWGAHSYSLGSDMARVSVAAAFIKSNMPRTRGWALSDQDAYDVAAYINSQPRPDVAGRASDWPKGEKPADAPH